MSRDSETVSKNMRSIHSKDTSIELQLRKALWHKGYRYRKKYKTLPIFSFLLLKSVRFLYIRYEIYFLSLE